MRFFRGYIRKETRSLAPLITLAVLFIAIVAVLLYGHGSLAPDYTMSQAQVDALDTCKY